jgi:hypothetical protein
VASRALLCLSCVLVGCFHWVRVDDPSEIRDERVRIVEPNGLAVEIDHACGAVSVNGPPDAQGASCVPVDPTRERVYVHRTHGWKSAAVVAIVTGVTAIVSMSFGFAVALAGARGSS